MKQKIRKILKFDSGKKGFERAAIILIAFAVLMILVAIYFLSAFF